MAILKPTKENAEVLRRKKVIEKHYDT
jgi:hypothetical protein